MSGKAAKKQAKRLTHAKQPLREASLGPSQDGEASNAHRQHEDV